MIGVFILTGIAFLLAVLLVFVDSKLNEEDIDIEKVLDLLPGYNCGACGYPGCKEMSHEILKEKENYKKCVPLRGENKKKMEEYLYEGE